MIKGLANRHAALFQLDLYQWQAIHQNSDIVTVGMTASLLKLFNHLYFIAGNGVLIQQVNVLNTAIVKHKVMDIVIMNFSGFIGNTVAGPIQKYFYKT